MTGGQHRRRSYTNALSDVPRLSRIVFRKRPSFRHEQEVRALIYDSSRPKEVYVKVNLEVLLDSVYVMPLAPRRVRDVLECEVRFHFMGAFLV